MADGKLYLFNKITTTILVQLDIIGNLNIEDNINDTPSNMKVKAITSNTYREEFEVNTIVYHTDTDSWWVIKSDESTYLHTGEYEHEIQLVELLEWFSFKHLPNCAFAPNTYTLDQMLERVFKIAKIPNVTITYPNFLDKDKLMPFMSFENFTVANAIKNIARTINAIPKMVSEPETNFDGFQLTFLSRQGRDDLAIKTILNDQFPIAYEKNANSSDQFLTRSISNIQNAKSSSPIYSPISGGYVPISPNRATYDSSVATSADLELKVILPSKIDKVLGLNVYVPVFLTYDTGLGSVTDYAYEYYFDKTTFANAIESISALSSAEKISAINNLPFSSNFYSVGSTGTIDKTYTPVNGRANMFEKKMIIKSKFDYDLTDDIDTKDRTAYYVPFTNDIFMPKSFRNGLTSNDDHNNEYLLFEDGAEKLYLRTASPLISDCLVQALYYPIADIKVSIDNDNDAQDEKFYNQSGKVIDAVSTSKLITSHTNDSVEGTKIRNARYTAFNQILPLGQLVRDSNQLYVITQRSIDGQIKSSNEYYNVIYTLSRNRVARSENIIADSAVINYKIPDDNLVFRRQLYKDYIELSLVSENNDTPYLSMAKVLELTNNVAGTKFDFAVLARNQYNDGVSDITVRYVKNPTVFDLHRAKLIDVNWQDNNVLGINLDYVSGTTYAQTPIVYTDTTGKATQFEVLFLDSTNLKDARNDYNSPTVVDKLVPFSTFNNVPESFYEEDVFDDGRYSIQLREDTYEKDAFEIPVFSYMIQANNSYTANGNIVVGDDLFTRYETAPSQPGTMRYHYIMSDTTRFTSENAIKLYNANPPSSATNKRVLVTRVNNNLINLQLYTTYTGTPNPSAFNHIGVYATDGIQQPKFLFAINDYVEGGDNDYFTIDIHINNWKI